MNGRKSFTPRKHPVSQAFVFMLLGIFAVMSTLMVLLSAQLYRSVIDRTEQNTARRILTGYVSNAVRGSDADGGVYADNRGGTDVLALAMDVDGDVYETLIYCHEGVLYELFMEPGQEFDPEYGSVICEAQSFAARIEDGLLTAEMTDGDGRSARIDIALRSGGGR